jgi:hypothetical protein
MGQCCATPLPVPKPKQKSVTLAQIYELLLQHGVSMRHYKPASKHQVIALRDMPSVRANVTNLGIDPNNKYLEWIPPHLFSYPATLGSGDHELVALTYIYNQKKYYYFMRKGQHMSHLVTRLALGFGIPASRIEMNDQNGVIPFHDHIMLASTTYQVTVVQD